MSETKDDQPAPKWWKFGLKSAYMLCSILGSQTEILYPKLIMQEFGLKCLDRLLNTYYKDIQQDEKKVT